jgi:hypothetical protein
VPRWPWFRGTEHLTCLIPPVRSQANSWRCGQMRAGGHSPHLLHPECCHCSSVMPSDGLGLFRLALYRNHLIAPFEVHARRTCPWSSTCICRMQGRANVASSQWELVNIAATFGDSLIYLPPEATVDSTCCDLNFAG